MEILFLGLTSEQWLDLGLSALIVVATVLVGRWLINFILNRIVRRAVGYTRTGLDDSLLEAFNLPLYLLAVVFGLQFAIARLDFISPAAAALLGNVFFVLYLTVGFFLAWRIVVRSFKWYGDEVARRTETGLDEKMMPFFRRVALIILTTIALIILLNYFNIDASSLVTTLGIGSLAIALAAQAALADMISGFVIMIDQPFRIGDRIEIQDLNTWGDVVDIGLRSSRVRTRDNRMVVVPNSVMSKSLVVNYSYPDTQYRIQVHVGVADDTDLEMARETMVKAVRSVEGVLPDRPVEALFLEFGESSLIFRVRWWIESYVDTRRMFDRVNTALLNALNEVGVGMPYPHRTLYHKVAPSDEERFTRILRGTSSGDLAP